jgi:type III pantothenate kinase
MSTLVINLGNTSLFGGIFDHRGLRTTFRAPVRDVSKPQELRALVPRRWRETIERIAYCSVVPALTPRFERLAQAAFETTPRRLTAAGDHGLRIRYPDPSRLGTDRLAAALGARALYPRRNVVVVDCGTATTVTAVGKADVIFGGAIFPGLGLWPEMLAQRTAQLPRVALRRPRSAVGRSPEQALQSGIFHGHAGAVREVTRAVSRDAFRAEKAVVIGTGGQASLFAREELFDVVEPSLVLLGLKVFADREAANGTLP